MQKELLLLLARHFNTSGCGVPLVRSACRISHIYCPYCAVWSDTTVLPRPCGPAARSRQACLRRERAEARRSRASLVCAVLADVTAACAAGRR